MKKPALAKKTKLLLWILGGVLVVGTITTAITVCTRQRFDVERRLHAIEMIAGVQSVASVPEPVPTQTNDKTDDSANFDNGDRFNSIERNNLTLIETLRGLVKKEGFRLPWNEYDDYAYLGLHFSYPPLPFYQYRSYAEKNISLDVSYNEGSFILYTETFYTATTTNKDCGPLLEPVVERVTINGHEFCRSESNGGGMSTSQELIQYSAVSPNGVLRATFEFWGIPHDRYCEEDDSCEKSVSDSKAFHSFVDSIMKTVRFEPKATP